MKTIRRVTCLVGVLTLTFFTSCNSDDDSTSEALTICEQENFGSVIPFAELIEERNFDGQNANVINLGSYNFTANTDFTFVGEVFPIDLQTFGRIWDSGPSDANNFRFHQNEGTSARIAVGQFDHVLTVSDFWELNTWIEVAVQYSSATQELRLYKNRQLIATETNVVIPSGQRDNLIIGASNWGANFPGSSEPNSIMRTRNFRFFFEELSEQCVAEFLDN